LESVQHLLYIPIIIVLLLFSAFFSGSETAFFSLSSFSLGTSMKGGRNRGLIKSLLQNPRSLLVTILFGNMLVNIASTSIVTAFAIRMYGDKGIGFAVVLMTFSILLFGEILPKSIALKSSVTIAAVSAPVMRFLMTFFMPFRVILTVLADYTVEKSKDLFGDVSTKYRVEELATAVEAAHTEGVFGEFEKEVLVNLLLFTETTVKEILVPRVDVFMLEVNTPFSEALIEVKNHGFSRVPVYEGSRDNIVGILLAKDMLKFSKLEKVEIRSIIKEPVFVPESKKVRELFGELTAKHQHIVIVVDEHGAFEGIVTLEDLLEEIFGEIRDRREPSAKEYLVIDHDHFVVEGTMHIEDVNRLIGADFESKEVETIAGFMIERLGRIPGEGESFEIDGFRFLVVLADETHIEKLRIERIDASRE